MTEELTRRELVKLGALGAGAAATGAACVGPGTGASHGLAGLQAAGSGQPPVEPFTAPPMDVVRIGFVGVGGQGQVHCHNLLTLEGVELRALCDIVPEKAEKVSRWVTEAGQAEPALYTRGDLDFIRMCENEELDLVYTATPWRWHVPVCVAAMENGKHAATEVPAAYTLEDCWKLVETAERQRKHCLMMENVSYGRTEMMVFHMVRQGLFGEILHAEGGYLHDLRSIKFASVGEGLWRREHAKTRNGNLYPTHGLGPIVNAMDINRGDRFDYLVSMSGPSRGLQAYARDHFPAGSPERDERYVLGDVNVSLLLTARGRTIFLKHDTNLPRPYSRIHMIQGTQGVFHGYPDRIHIEGRSPDHRWEEAGDYREEFEHPLWRQLGESSERVGHGGMDWMEDYRLIKCLREGLPPDTNVYDAAAVSAVCELSERSVADRSRPVGFPDFTRGRWQTNPPLGIVEA